MRRCARRLKTLSSTSSHIIAGRHRAIASAKFRTSDRPPPPEISRKLRPRNGFAGVQDIGIEVPAHLRFHHAPHAGISTPIIDDDFAGAMRLLRARSGVISCRADFLVKSIITHHAAQIYSRRKQPCRRFQWHSPRSRGVVLIIIGRRHQPDAAQRSGIS